MKDWTLLLVIITAIAVDVFIVTVGTAIPQSRLKAKVMPSDVLYSISVSITLLYAMRNA